MPQRLFTSFSRRFLRAASGDLLKLLDLKNLDMDPPRPETTPEEDMMTSCPAEPIDIQAPDKESVFKRALAKEELLRSQFAPAAPEPATPAAPPPPAVPEKKTKHKK